MEESGVKPPHCICARRSTVSFPFRPRHAGAQNVPAPLDILHEDARLLVINKPADLVCHPTKGDEWSSLVGRVRLHLGPQAESHLINRLDRETSGIVVVARDLRTARAWRSVWELREVTKRYLAIVEGHVPSAEGVIEAPLGRDDASPVAIKDRVRPDGAAAVTAYRVLSTFVRDGAPFTHLEVVPRTGRKHQIRIHLAHLGHPIVGDKIYGPDERIYLDFVAGRMSAAQGARLRMANHALHAASLEATVDGGSFRFECAPPPPFQAFLPPAATTL
jgi:23S rRNA pseudouridine1911/1915/1917 synthase